mmetsp:Transcript_85826/g.164200  ORF Transcript_85826/g.164200 Transcript_85826/m.164200 type:complete len:217 (-) Transcript_85826:158-808(-)
MPLAGIVIVEDAEFNQCQRCSCQLLREERCDDFRRISESATAESRQYHRIATISHSSRDYEAYLCPRKLKVVSRCESPAADLLGLCIPLLLKTRMLQCCTRHHRHMKRLPDKRIPILFAASKDAHLWRYHAGVRWNWVLSIPLLDCESHAITSPVQVLFLCASSMQKAATGMALTSHVEHCHFQSSLHQVISLLQHVSFDDLNPGWCARVCCFSAP